MKKYIKLSIMLTLCMLLGVVASAQRGPKRPPGPPPQIPIDGGLSWLAAAGVAYGARKWYLYNKQSDCSE